MKTGQVVLLAWLATCLVSDCLALTLPGILSSFTASRKADEPEAEKDQELKEEQQDKHPTTHRPTRRPILTIPHPADTPLNPYNNPNHPLHPDNIPALPQLPALPHFNRETIHATKTVFVEITDRLTIHPVCMTAYKVTPPCLPFDPHHHNQLNHHHSHHKKEEQEDLDDKKLQEASVIKPTAVIELEPTRILGGVTVSEASPEAAENAVEQAQPGEIPVVEPSSEDSRSGRYMELTPSISSADKVEIKDDPVEHHGPAGAGSQGTSPLHVVQNLLHHPVTHYKTKTLLVTKVEKVLDTRVTATLLAENCIPTNSHIPLCAPHGGLVGPGYHGYHGGNIYTESFGGHIVAGLHTEKRPGYNPEGDVHEQVHSNKEDEHQGKEDDMESEIMEDEE